MQMSAAIQAQLIPEFTDQLRQSREKLNQLIEIFGGELLDLFAEDSSARFRDTYLAPYIEPASAKSKDYHAFFHELNTAYTASAADATPKAQATHTILNTFIGSMQPPVSRIQERIGTGIAWFLSLAHSLDYADFAAFVRTATAFEEADVAAIADESFDLSSHFHRVLDIVDSVTHTQDP
jgi:hypothetical protein